MEPRLSQQLATAWHMVKNARMISLIVGLMAGALTSSAQPTETGYSIWGKATNGVQPFYYFSRGGADHWSVDMYFRAETNVPDDAWLKITNRAGARLRLWLPGGGEVQSTNQDVLAAFNLPVDTTVSNVLRGVERQGRYYIWPRFGSAWARNGATNLVNGAVFSPATSFNVSSTNEYVLQIVPLLYRVETDKVATHLVEFPPVRVRLLPEGDLKILDGSE